MTYKPTFKSFLGMIFTDLSPAIIAGLAYYFLRDSLPFVIKIISVGMVIFSLFLFSQSVFVHLQKLYIDEKFIRLSNLLTSTEIKWEDILAANIRERPKQNSRPTRMVVLESDSDTIYLHTSTFKEEDETDILEKIQQKIAVAISKDRPV